MQFRRDINGLRAIAVIAVVLFHFNASWMPGGFAGVDVFFVISGYLMTGIIFRGLGQSNFSILKFYSARAHRIVPALAVLCLVVLVFGWFYLTPQDYKTLGEHVATSINFLSNFIYWSESGYFDVESREKWLLHTWSLSVEWQFYLLYPVLLVVLHRFLSLPALKTTVLLGSVFGFVFCAVATYKWPSASYYLLPARVWEMLVGGVAYLYPLTLTTKNQKVLERFGLLLIVGSYLLISKANPWPGLLAVFPVLGAFLLIQAQRQNSFIANNVVLQKLGVWSYSIYLWHWPLVVVVYIFDLSVAFTYVGILLSVLLGFASNKYIERAELKQGFNNILVWLKRKPGYQMALLTGLSAAIIIDGELNSNTELLEYADKVTHPIYCHVDGDYSADNLDCRLGSEQAKPVGLLWGDSFAGALDPFVTNLLADGQSVISRTTSHCFPALSLASMLGGLPEYCRLIRKENSEQIAQNKFDVIFLAGRWDSMYRDYGDAGLAAVIDAIRFSAKHAKAVYFFEQPIFYKRNVANIFLRTKISPLYPDAYERDDERTQGINQKLRAAIAQQNFDNVYTIDRDTMYGSSTHSDLTPNGLPYTYDRGHLTEVGSIQASENFMRSDAFKPLGDILSQETLGSL